MENGNESFTGFATVHAMCPPQILDHSPPPASLSSIQPEVPRIESPGPFLSTIWMKTKTFASCLTGTYSLDVRHKFYLYKWFTHAQL